MAVAKIRSLLEDIESCLAQSRGSKNHKTMTKTVIIMKTISGSSWSLPKIRLLLDAQSRRLSLA